MLRRSDEPKWAHFPPIEALKNRNESNRSRCLQERLHLGFLRHSRRPGVKQQGFISRAFLRADDGDRTRDPQLGKPHGGAWGHHREPRRSRRPPCNRSDPAEDEAQSSVDRKVELKVWRQLVRGHGSDHPLRLQGRLQIRIPFPFREQKAPTSRAFRVERTGIEPVTSGLQSRRSPS